MYDAFKLECFSNTPHNAYKIDGDDGHESVFGYDCATLTLTHSNVSQTYNVVNKSIEIYRYADIIDGWMVDKHKNIVSLKISPGHEPPYYHHCHMVLEVGGPIKSAKHKLWSMWTTTKPKQYHGRCVTLPY